jgi:hypothetical protein
MRIPPVLAALCIVLLHTNLTAQHESCGTHVSEALIAEYAKTAEARANYQANLRSGPLQLPLKIHIVRYSDGSAGLAHNDLYDEFLTLNRNFAPAQVQFYLCGPVHYIDNDFYAEATADSRQQMTQEFDHEGAINIYFVPKLIGDGTILSGLAVQFNPQFPDVHHDHIYISSGVGVNGSTLSHEVGHYLSLLHTHTTINGVATADGTNCHASGDQICDTPADPMLIGLVDKDCDYTGTVKDANGQAYHPLTNNLMSYAPATCRSSFTSQQLSRIQWSAMYERAYLGCSDTFHLERLPEFTELPIRLTPNPSSQYARIAIDNMAAGESDVRVSVYNLRGEEVFSTVRSHSHRSSDVQIDLTGYEKGIYLVSADNGSLRGMQKLIVQ